MSSREQPRTAGGPCRRSNQIDGLQPGLSFHAGKHMLDSCVPPALQSVSQYRTATAEYLQASCSQEQLGAASWALHALYDDKGFFHLLVRTRTRSLRPLAHSFSHGVGDNGADLRIGIRSSRSFTADLPTSQPFQANQIRPDITATVLTPSTRPL